MTPQGSGAEHIFQVIGVAFNNGNHVAINLNFKFWISPNWAILVMIRSRIRL